MRTVFGGATGRRAFGFPPLRSRLAFKADEGMDFFGAFETDAFAGFFGAAFFAGAFGAAFFAVAVEGRDGEDSPATGMGASTRQAARNTAPHRRSKSPHSTPKINAKIPCFSFRKNFACCSIIPRNACRTFRGNAMEDYRTRTKSIARATSPGTPPWLVPPRATASTPIPKSTHSLPRSKAPHSPAPARAPPVHAPTLLRKVDVAPQSLLPRSAY